VISDSSNKVVANVTVGNTPDGFAYDSAKDEVFVSNYGPNTVSVLSESTATSSTSSSTAPEFPTAALATILVVAVAMAAILSRRVSAKQADLRALRIA